jgi:hypothetical protein
MKEHGNAQNATLSFAILENLKSAINAEEKENEMTNEELTVKISEMTDEEINIEILKFRGWDRRTQTEHPLGTDGKHPWTHPDKSWAIYNDWDLPNYSQDLNAMHETERVFFEPEYDQERCGDYWIALCKTTGFGMGSIGHFFATAR